MEPLVALDEPVFGGRQQCEVVAKQGQLRKHGQPCTVRFCVLDQADVLHRVGEDSTVEGLVLDGGHRQGIGHLSILGNRAGHIQGEETPPCCRPWSDRGMSGPQ